MTKNGRVTHEPETAKGPIAVRNRDYIIAQVAEGKELADIARELGIKSPNISKYLAKDPEYYAAREHGAEQRLRRSRQALEEIAELGKDPETGEIVGVSQQVSNLARVRAERLKADQWFAEREFPHKWGQKQEVSINLTADISDRLLRARERVIEGQACTVSTKDTQVIDSKGSPLNR